MAGMITHFELGTFFLSGFMMRSLNVFWLVELGSGVFVAFDIEGEDFPSLVVVS